MLLCTAQTRPSAASHTAALLVLFLAAAWARVVRLHLGRLGLGGLGRLLDQRAEALVLVELEAVVLRLGGDDLLPQPIAHRPALEEVVAALAHVVIGALAAAIAVPDNRARRRTRRR